MTVMRPKLKKKISSTDWKVIVSSNCIEVKGRHVTNDIVKRMPDSTETFIESGLAKAFLNRMRHFLKTGK